jgi:membrane dipeptidase
MAQAHPSETWRERQPAYADAIVCDGLLPWTESMLPPGASLAGQLARFHRAGFDHISLSAAAGRDGLAETLTRLGFFRRALAATGGQIVIADDHAAIVRAKREALLSVSFHVQTATPFATDLDLVEAFRGAGVIRAILAYNEANAFADGCHEPRNGGLSAQGLALIRRMDRAGMIVDLSHCGERTSLDALEADLARPPIFSHSNARALFDHERNITDDQIRAAARRGGYVGINGVGMFLGVAGPAIPQAIARHAAHVAELIGPQRVGLGLDFMFLDGSDYGFYHANKARWPRGYPAPPWAFVQPEQLGELVAELERVGFSSGEVVGLLGANYLRVHHPAPA